MDDIKRGRNNRTIKLRDYLNQNAAELATTPADVAPLKIELDEIILLTLQNDGKAIADNSGVTEEKNTERAELTHDLNLIIPFLVKHFTTTKNPQARRLIDFTPSQIDAMDDSLLYTEADKVNSTATPIMAALILIKYTALEKTAFDDNLEDYLAMLGKPREAIGESSSWSKEVETNLETQDEIRGRIRIEMNTIRTNFSQLFNAYESADSIDSSGSGGGSNVFTGSVNSGETKQVAPVVYDPTIVFKLENTGGTQLIFMLFLAGVQTGASVTVNAGDITNSPITDFSTDGDALMVRNPDGTIGTYKVTIN